MPKPRADSGEFSVAAAVNAYCSSRARCSALPLARPSRCLILGRVALVFLGLMGAVVPSRAATLNGKIRTVEELDFVRDLSAPRAFVKGNDIRLYYTNDGQRLVFKAAWKKAPLEGRDYVYYIAPMRYDKTPPQIPQGHTAWREAGVVDRLTWSNLTAEAAEQLTPSTPGHGTYFQTQATEGVLYRDATGRVRTAKFQGSPPDTVIDQRLNAQELTTTLARLVESRLREAHPDQNLFLITTSLDDRGEGFILLDFSRRICVLLNAPRIADDPRGGPHLGNSVASLGSITLESHGLAILKNPVSSTMRLLNLGVQTMLSLVGTGLRNYGVPPPLTNAPGLDLVAWEKRLGHLTHTPADRGSVKFLIDGENFFPAFERRLEEAQRSINIEVNIFDHDDVAVEVADILRRKSATVKVDVLMDRMCSQGSARQPPGTAMPEGFDPPSSIGSYLEHGSKVRVRPYLNPWFTADHAKVFTIDGRTSYLGGMNIGREYRYEWHDMMVEIEGPIVAHFESDFARAWAHASLLGDCAYAGQALWGKSPKPTPGEDPNWIPLRRLYTRTASTQIRAAEMEAIHRAQNRIFLENPYLYDKEVVNSIVAARHRGVDVRVVLPSDNDFAPGKSSNLVIANHLQRNGVRVFLYPGMTHAKGLIVDGWACFGSANFNKLSLQLNHEVNVATSDPGTVERLRAQLFEVDFAKSHELLQPVEASWTDDIAETILTQF